MPLLEYRSTTYFKAFLLYALVGSLIASVAVHIRLSFDKNKYGIRKWIGETFGIGAELKSNSILRLLFAFLLTFFVSILIYHLMYFIFGWGGGMLVSKKKEKIGYFT